MHYQYTEVAKNIAYESIKTVLALFSSGVCLYVLANSPENAFALGSFTLLFFAIFLHGIYALITRGKELQFIEISHETIRFRAETGGAIQSMRAANVEFAIVGSDHIELAMNGVEGIYNLTHGSINPEDVVAALKTVAPNSIVKTRLTDD